MGRTFKRRALFARANPATAAHSDSLADEVRPGGLRDDVELTAERWIFINGFEMAWSRRMANGARLCDALNTQFFELARRYFTALRNDIVRAELNALSTIQSKVYRLCALIDYAILQGKPSFTHLSFLDIEHFRDMYSIPEREEERLVVETILSMLGVIDDLSRLYAFRIDGQKILNDGLSFTLYPDFNQATAYARKHGRATDPTEDIPESVAFAHVDAAIEYVIFHSDTIIDLDARVSEEKYKLSESKLATRRRKRARNNSRPAQLADLLVSILDSPQNPYVKNGLVSRAAVARAIQSDVSNLYDARFERLIRTFEGYSTDGSATALEMFMGEVERVRRVFAQAKVEAARGDRLDFVRDFKVAYYENAKYLSGPITCYQSGRGGEFSLEAARSNLFSAVLLLVLALMGDRLNEGLQLSVDCLVERPDGLFLRSPNFKSDNTESGTYLEQPCPMIVAIGIKALKQLSAKDRALAGTDKLFFFRNRLQASVPNANSIRNYLANFGKSTGASNVGVDAPWTVNSRQLRRLFPTVWLTYFSNAPKFNSLRTFLNHSDISTLESYYSGKMITGEYMMKLQKRHTFDVLSQNLLEGIDMKGGFAKRARRLVKGVELRVENAKKIAALTASWIDKFDVGINPMPWGYCFWSKLAGNHAKCISKERRKSGIERPSTKKSCLECGQGCLNFMETEAFVGFWESADKHHAEILANDCAPARLKDAARRAIEICKRFLGVSNV